MNYRYQTLTRKLCSILASVFLAFIVMPIYAGSDIFTRATLQSATLQCVSNGCLDFKYGGTCFWAVKHRPYVETSSYVSHFLPDVVVSVFSEPDQDSYDEGRVIDQTLYSLVNPTIKLLLNSKTDLSGGQNHAATFDELNEKIKDVSILPNPAVFDLEHMPLLIPTLVNRADVFYYDSIPDFFMWRLGLAEINVGSLLSEGLGSIGSGANNTWGSMYAQEGTIDGVNNYVDSAVIAMRAAGLIDGGDYEAGKGRAVHQKLAMQCQTSHCNALDFSVAIDEHTRTVKWQRVYPDVTETAISFGEQDIKAMTGDMGDAPADINDGNYAWIMWRKYEGCVPHDGKFLFKI